MSVYEPVVTRMLRRGMRSLAEPDTRPEALSNVVEVMSQITSELLKENVALNDRVKFLMRSVDELYKVQEGLEKEIKLLKSQGSSKNKVRAKK